MMDPQITPPRCLESGRRRSRVSDYLQLPHAGRIAIVSNSALEAARGKYIAILDDDDRWIDPDKLKKQVAFLDEHPEYVACAGGFTIVNQNDERTADIYKPESDQAMRKVALLANPIANSTAMFRGFAQGEV